MTCALIVLTLALAAGPPTAEDLPAIKAKVMSADYRADITELARLRDEINGRHDDGKLAYLAKYWSGYASWRMAINGASNGMPGADLEANLLRAASDFDASCRLNPRFADSFAAAAQVNGWLATFFISRDAAAFRKRIEMSQSLLDLAKRLDPTNPRVLWATGGVRLFGLRPDIEAALADYRRMLREAERRGTDSASPLPDWGKPEALMSMAYAHMSSSPPQIALARQEAAAALELVPNWSYVRNNLMKMIEQSQP
jgi:hypothetical protein